MIPLSFDLLGDVVFFVKIRMFVYSEKHFALKRYRYT